MRLKGISPIEQHAEKAFLGLFLVAGLGVLAWQFVGQESTVKVGKDEVRLADAYARIDEERKRTDARIRAAAPEGMPSLENAAALQQLAEFETRYRGPVSPAPQLAVALDRAGPTVTGSSVSPRDLVQLNEVVAPAPGAPVAGAYMAAIDPGEARADPAVAAVLPAEAPFDKGWVSVETSFDGTALRAALGTDPDSDGPIRAIPKNWWDSGMSIFAVLMERQTLRPDGSWSAPEPVKPMPGRPSLADQLDGLNTAVRIKDVARWSNEQAGAVRRPDFYAIQVGESWAPPTERDQRLAEQGDKESRVRTLMAQRADKIRRRDAIARELQSLGGGGTSPGPRPPGGPGGGGGGAGAPGRPGGGGGGAAPPPSGGGNTANESRRRSLQGTLDRLNREIAQHEADLRDLGQNVGDPNQPAPVVPVQGGRAPAGEPVLDTQSLRIWAHDVHVQRGATYRYRVRLALNNPYFGHAAAMLPAQAPLAAKGVMYTPFSDWSEPVQVDPETYLFFTSASEDDTGARAATAKAEVYQFRWGFWRRGQAVLEPGDSVLTDIRVPDMSKMPAEPVPGADPVPAPGAGRPGAAPGGAGRPGGRPDGPGGRPDAPADPVVPPGQRPRPVNVPMIGVPVSDPTILLGVGSMPEVDADGRQVAVQQIYLRDPGGQVVVRVPDDERSSSAYQRVSSSADRGEREQSRPADQPRNPASPQDAPPAPGARPSPDAVPPMPGG
jgi:hypothetical protein